MTKGENNKTCCNINICIQKFPKKKIKIITNRFKIQTSCTISYDISVMLFTCLGGCISQPKSNVSAARELEKHWWFELDSFCVALIRRQSIGKSSSAKPSGLQHCNVSSSSFIGNSNYINIKIYISLLFIICIS